MDACLRPSALPSRWKTKRKSLINNCRAGSLTSCWALLLKECPADAFFYPQPLLLSTIVSSGMQGRQFDVVLDANLYHCFSPGANRDAYVANLAQLVKPGKRCLAY